MKAAVLYEQKKPLVVDDITLEDPKQGEVMVKMAAAGVCRSDLTFIDGLWPALVPMVMGHEGAGVVEKIGPGVSLVQPGDHVILSFVSSCGTCRNCVRGKPYLCSAGSSSTMKDGTTRFKKGDQVLYHQTAVSAFSEYIVTHETSMVKIRDDMPLDKAALIGCGVMTGVGAAINTAKVKVGSCVAVFGCGGVGLNVIQGAVLSGAAKIIAVDTLNNKLEMAKKLGATHTINAAEEDPVMKIIEISGAMGADYSFEVVGLPELVTQAFDATDPGGEAIMVGMSPIGAPITINSIPLFMGKTLKGAFYGSTRFRIDMPMLVDLYMGGKLKLDELITRVYPLEKINDAFDALRKGEVARSIIKF